MKSDKLQLIAMACHLHACHVPYFDPTSDPTSADILPTFSDVFTLFICSRHSSDVSDVFTLFICSRHSSDISDIFALFIRSQHSSNVSDVFRRFHSFYLSQTPFRHFLTSSDIFHSSDVFHPYVIQYLWLTHIMWLKQELWLKQFLWLHYCG